MNVTYFHIKSSVQVAVLFLLDVLIHHDLLSTDWNGLLTTYFLLYSALFQKTEYLYPLVHFVSIKFASISDLSAFREKIYFVI